jgi:hypothetical protein
MLSDVSIDVQRQRPRDFMGFVAVQRTLGIDETVFARYARHHLTDEPMPARSSTEQAIADVSAQGSPSPIRLGRSST